MSKSITITGVYRNGKRNTVGLYDTRNVDMINIQFDANELIDKAAKYFVNKIFKRFEINIAVSDSMGNLKAQAYNFQTIGDKDIREAITIINSSNI